MADPNKFPAPTVVPNPPKNDPISTSQLAKANGVNGAPIWIAIKGRVFDVSAKTDTYGPGGPYHVFAGKDASKGLGLSSVKPEDAVADYSSLGPAEVKVLDDWLSFFQKRYNQIGRVSA